MNQREKFVNEINRLEKALSQTRSKYLKADYKKAIIRMRRELREYDWWIYGSKKVEKQNC